MAALADADRLDPPQLERLKKRWQFLAVARGASAARGAVVIQALSRESAEASPACIGVGFTATKKIGGAVVRNRAKRRLREAARRLLPVHGQAGCDYVFIARAGAPTREWARLLDDVKSALISLAAGGDGPHVRSPHLKPKPATRRGSHSSARNAPSGPASPG